MGNFIDLLIFIGALYKLAVAAVIVVGIGYAVLAVLMMIGSMIKWFF